MGKIIDADAYIKYCDEHWIPLNINAVNDQPELSVVPKEEYDLLKELYTGLLHSAAILSAAVRGYENREESREI